MELVRMKLVLVCLSHDRSCKHGSSIVATIYIYIVFCWIVPVEKYVDNNMWKHMAVTLLFGPYIYIYVFKQISISPWFMGMSILWLA